MTPLLSVVFLKIIIKECYLYSMTTHADKGKGLQKSEIKDFKLLKTNPFSR